MGPQRPRFCRTRPPGPLVAGSVSCGLSSPALDRYPLAADHSTLRPLLHTISLIEDLSLRPVVSRLAKLLLMQLADDQQVVLPRQRWATQAEIAARLGTVPDVVNRALRSLAEEGLIRVTRHQIIILDRAGLAAKAQS